MNQKILEIVLDLRDKLAPKLKQTAASGARSVGRLTTAVQKMKAGFMAGMVAIAAMVAAIVAVIAITRKFIKALNEVVEAAMVQERAINTLNASLIASGEYSIEASEGLQEYARGLQATLGIGDEVTLQTLGLISGLTKLSAEALPKAMTAVIQISKLYSVDYNNAALLLGKTLTSQMNAFSRYGIEVDLTADAQGRLNQIIESTTAGMVIAEKQAQSYEGQIIKVRAAWGDFNEVLGAFVTESPTVIASLDLMLDVIQDLTGAVDNNSSAVKQFVNIALSGLVASVTESAKSILILLKSFLQFHRGLVRIAEAFGLEALFPAERRAGLWVLNAQIAAVDAAITSVTAKQIEFIGTIIRNMRASDGLNNSLGNLNTTLTDTASEAGSAASEIEVMVTALERLASIRETRFPAMLREVPLMSLFGPGVEELLAGRKLSAQGVIGAPGYIGPGFDVTRAEMGFMGMPFDLPEPKITEAGTVRFTNEIMQSIAASMIGAFAAGGPGGAFAAGLPMIGTALFGPVGGAIGGYLGQLFGRKKARGDSPSNPTFTKIINPEDLATAFLGITGGLVAAAGAAGLNVLVQDIRAQAQRIGAS